MPMMGYVLTAIGIAAVTGGALTAYLWLVRRKHFEISAGITALAAMRWREFSHFVIEALQAQGFEAAQEIVVPERGQHPDLSLIRDGQTWLLSCKQGANYRINSAQMAELADAVRFEGAAGGILATLGRFHSDARKHHHGLELLDGPALLALIEPLLPPSLHQDLEQRARKDATRHTIAAWVIALALGATIAALLAMRGDTASAPVPVPDANTVTEAEPVPAPAVQGPATPVDGDSAPLATLLSEAEQRNAVARDISSLQGIEVAAWSTRSTLLIQLQQESVRVDDICTVLDRYPDLQSSRLQLQPPSGSSAAVRFTQCQLF